MLTNSNAIQYNTNSNSFKLSAFFQGASTKPRSGGITWQERRCHYICRAWWFSSTLSPTLRITSSSTAAAISLQLKEFTGEMTKEKWKHYQSLEPGGFVLVCSPLTVAAEEQALPREKSINAGIKMQKASLSDDVAANSGSHQLLPGPWRKSLTKKMYLKIAPEEVYATSSLPPLPLLLPSSAQGSTGGSFIQEEEDNMQEMEVEVCNKIKESGQAD